MTFYWWSHWFWITIISTTFFFTNVQTYPSQEFRDEEYNQNSSKSVTTTKLFPTSTTLIWATTAPPTSTQIMDLTQGGVITARDDVDDDKSSESSIENVNTNFNEYEEVEALEIETGKNEIGKPKDDATYMDENSEEDYEFKRSAEIVNNDNDRTPPQKHAEMKVEAEKQQSNLNDTQDKSAIAARVQTNRKPTITIAEDDSVISSKIITNNDKATENNFSVNSSNLSTNSPTNVNNITASSSTTPLTMTTTTTTSTSSNSSAPPSAPAAPQIDSVSAAAEWLHTAIVAPPPPPPPAVQQPNIEDISSNLVTTATASQKVPFTLENVNKEDELRRAESEHRSRKSKVLNADYKQINRYINYSSDPKSLLTRSASTAPNEFNGDNESNISSEALAIQRTYFLDAGSISAICFTVFGVCCTVGTIGIVLYRRRYLNKPQTLSEPDSSVYIDDSTMRVSDNSDEMYSLDNDSFLNSLEAMTIQNYWTDTVKHTKL